MALPLADIVSEGNIGLMQAVKRFDPDRGVRLATYAMWWIKATIQEYVLRSWSMVKIAASGAQKKLFFKLRRAKARISALQESDLRPEQIRWIADRLEVPERDVVDMNGRLRADVSLSAPGLDENESGQTSDRLVDHSPSQESTLAQNQEVALRQRALASALAKLKPRERSIFTARRLADQPPKLEELAAEYGISRERVRQIELRAFQKVQAAVRETISLPAERPRSNDAQPRLAARLGGSRAFGSNRQAIAM